MPRNPFSTPSKRRSKADPSPKTIANRKCEQGKRGLDLALKRDVSAFRTAKSRKLAFFRRSTKHAELGPMGREIFEKKIVADLESQRDKKMRIHTMQWRKMIETGQVASDNDFELEDDNDNDEQELEMQDSRESDSWIEEEEMDIDVPDDDVGLKDVDNGVLSAQDVPVDEDLWIDDDGDEEFDKVDQSVYAATFSTTFLDVRRIAKKRWDEKMKIHEETALEADKIWRMFDNQ
jgi:hypothetical protein